MSGPDDAAVYDALCESIPGRVLTSVWSRLSADWQDSAILARLRRLARGLDQGSPARNLRLIATAIAWAALFHLALRTALPQYATSALPLWTNLVLMLVAGAAVINAGTLVAHWPGSAAARLWRRFVAG